MSVEHNIGFAEALGVHYYLRHQYITIQSDTLHYYCLLLEYDRKERERAATPLDNIHCIQTQQEYPQ